MIFITSFQLHLLALMFYLRFGLFNIGFRSVNQNFCANWLGCRNHRAYWYILRISRDAHVQGSMYFLRI